MPMQLTGVSRGAKDRRPFLLLFTEAHSTETTVGLGAAGKLCETPPCRELFVVGSRLHLRVDDGHCQIRNIGHWYFGVVELRTVSSEPTLGMMAGHTHHSYTPVQVAQ